MSAASYIEAAPKRKRGCLGLGCATLLIIGVLLIAALGVGGYFFLSRGYLASEPTAIPVEEIPDEQLADTKQRIEEFKSGVREQPAAEVAAAATTATAPPSAPRQQISAAEINGLIAANKRARGHAYVTLSGNTATVQISLAADKIGLEGRYLNGSFAIKTDGPTPLDRIAVNKIEANGMPVPSGILQWRYRGRTLLGYGVEALAPYNVKTLEIRDGVLMAQ
jgi:hypothetical protein